MATSAAPRKPRQRKKPDGTPQMFQACPDCGRPPRSPLDAAWFNDADPARSRWLCLDCHQKAATAAYEAVHAAQVLAAEEAKPKPVTLDDQIAVAARLARAQHQHHWVWLRQEPGSREFVIRHLNAPDEVAEPERRASDVFYCQHCPDGPNVQRVVAP